MPGLIHTQAIFVCGYICLMATHVGAWEMTGRVVEPRRCPCPNSWTHGFVTSMAGVIKLSYLTWKVSLGYPECGDVMGSFLKNRDSKK
jgi:hypothetical protein